jgi:hypothetical protein
VQDLFIHPRDRDLVIATYGRGVYVMKNEEWPSAGSGTAKKNEE